MALCTPSKRAVSSALAFTTTCPTKQFICLRHSRTIFSWLRSSTGPKPNPLDPRAKSTQKPVLPVSQTAGDLASSSIFEKVEGAPEGAPKSPSHSSSQRQVTRPTRPRRHDPTLTAPALDPHPHARQRWERKILIRSLHRRFRTRKSVRLLRTERSSVTKSHFLETSIKKLGPLARQIAGKPIEDAIVQMRFSKKRVAGEVMKHLRYARDEAVVRKGMGLGNVVREGAEQEKEKQGGVVILKNGKKRVVEDRTGIYVDQAWVGRGSYGREPDYRARGQVYTLRPPTTSITVLLKEEATRIRLSEEREEKRKLKKAWVPLPDRPVTAQRQYCLW
ncbi:54S ribosomal protein L22, mitochondrial [Xylographa opegraphella]|nr:54S ribosomal protein L22, mitochondrial [Xylographa opegraphella]